MHSVKDLEAKLVKSYSDEPLFQAALIEFLENVLPYLESVNASDSEVARLRRLIVPERIITFKIVWDDDNGNVEQNLGYRIQFNSALGPYKGGLRFDPTVSEDVLKFLAFEQVFKNALTGLPLGGGKGGSDFDPKGKSDNEIRRFCTAFITELARYIGPLVDSPAGDIGVGSKELGYMYGAYKKLMNTSDGAITGKGVDIGGSHIRPEATGYGAVYFVKEMLAHAGQELKNKRVVISGSGNVAVHVAEKIIEEGGVPLSLSDRGGYIYAEQGISKDTLEIVKKVKADRSGTLKGTPLPPNTIFKEGSVWQEVAGDICMPSATQNEIKAADAEAIVKHGTKLVAECANMPTTLEAVLIFEKAGILFGPAKAVNAGGVAVSGLEMSQHAVRMQWTREEVDAKLRDIMKHIHATCIQYGSKGGKVNYIQGANLGGFIRVFNAMKNLGW